MHHAPTWACTRALRVTLPLAGDGVVIRTQPELRLVFMLCMRDLAHPRSCVHPSVVVAKAAAEVGLAKAEAAAPSGPAPPLLQWTTAWSWW